MNICQLWRPPIARKFTAACLIWLPLTPFGSFIFPLSQQSTTGRGSESEELRSLPLDIFRMSQIVVVPGPNSVLTHQPRESHIQHVLTHIPLHVLNGVFSFCMQRCVCVCAFWSAEQKVNHLGGLVTRIWGCFLRPSLGRPFRGAPRIHKPVLFIGVPLK